MTLFDRSSWISSVVVDRMSDPVVPHDALVLMDTWTIRPFTAGGSSCCVVVFVLQAEGAVANFVRVGCRIPIDVPIVEPRVAVSRPSGHRKICPRGVVHELHFDVELPLDPIGPRHHELLG